MKDQLAKNPFQGEILRYTFLREKRIREKRVYFSIYEEWRVVLLITIGNKKAQGATIDEIVECLRIYKESVKQAILRASRDPPSHPPNFS